MRILKRIDLAGFVLEPGERALIRSEIVGGAVLATNEALHIASSDRQSHERIEWWKMKRVSFDPVEMSLRIATENARAEFILTIPSLLPETVRERVTATILTSITFAPPNDAKAVISLRRRPTTNGEATFIEIEWQGSPSESVRAQAEQRSHWLKEQASL